MEDSSEIIFDKIDASEIENKKNIILNKGTTSAQKLI
jgi:hypothetical protein